MALLDRFRRASNTPPAIEQSLVEQGMNNGNVQFGPGRPLNPSQGYSNQPRAMDYPAGVNINVDGRGAWGRTSFHMIKEIIDAYPIARGCINHKIDEIRSMEPLFAAQDGFTGDADGAVQAARAALEFPDRELPFDEWVSKLMENALRYDATPLYRRRNYGGEVIAYEVLDGPTIVPKIDARGRRPMPPATAYQEIIKGMPLGSYTSQDMEYRRFRPQTDSPYGLAPIESMMISANTGILAQWHFMQMFTEGSIPGGFIETPPDVSNPSQVAEWQDYYDAMVLGDQAKMHQLLAVPGGTKVTRMMPDKFDQEFVDYLDRCCCIAFGVVPQDLGMTADVNRATGETQTDIQFRVKTLPWVHWVEGICNRYVQHDLGLPVKIDLDTGRDTKDRFADAQAWDLATKGGAVSVDEWRQEIYGLPVDSERPMPRGLFNPRTGWIPLTSMLAIAGKIDSETGAPVNDVPLDQVPYDGAAGVLADKLPGVSAFKRAPINPDEPNFPELEHSVPGSDVVGTLPSLPVIGDPGVPVVKPLPAGPVAKSVGEATVFGRFVKARAKVGKWRDFEFTNLAPVEAHRLNQQGRGMVAKAAGEIVAAGLCVQAADTGRVLMLQRGLDETDDAALAGDDQIPLASETLADV